MGRHPVDDNLHRIEQRICHAAWVISKMPSDRPSSFKQWWPHYDLEEVEVVSDIRIRPQKHDIDKMHEVFDKWLPLLTVDERLMVWERCKRGRLLSWRKIAQIFNRSHEDCRKTCRNAYLVIFQRLLSR